MDGGDVGPVVALDDVEHGPGLQRVGGDHPEEVFVERFVAQVDAGGGVSDLGDVEELEQILDLDSNRAGAGADDPRDGLFHSGLGLGLRVGHAAGSSVPVVPDGDEGVPYELDALLQGHRGVPAGVSDLAAQGDVR